MSVSYTMVYQDAVSLPAGGAVNYNLSNPLPQGTIESWGIQITGSPAGAPSTVTMSQLLSQLRITFNGNQWFNFNDVSANNANVGASRFGCLVNDMGGTVAENWTTVAGAFVDMTVWIPCGIQVAQNSRFEMALSFAAAANALLATVGANLTIWCKYGTSSSATVTGNMTSQNLAAGAQTLVSVQIPTFANSKISGIAISGTAAGVDSMTACVIEPLGNFALSPTAIRNASGSGNNGYQFFDPAVSLTRNAIANECLNYYFVPLYDLVSTDGNVNLLVTQGVGGGAAQIFYFTPILKLPTGGSGQQTPKQTASQKTGGAASILARAEDSTA